LKCFDQIPDAGASFGMNLYVSIPSITHPAQPFDGNWYPGHVMISIYKYNANQTIRQTIGFYPNSIANALGFSVDSKIVNDGDPQKTHEYNASIIMNGLTASEFNTVLNTLRTNSHRQCNLFNSYNCSDFAIDAFNSVRITNKLIPLPYDPRISQYLPKIPSSPQATYMKLLVMKNNNSPESANIEIGVKKLVELSKGACQ